MNKLGASLVAQMVKNLSAVWETQVQSLGQEDPLEKGMTTHSGILAWRIPWTEEPGGLQSIAKRVRHNLATKHTHRSLFKEVRHYHQNKNAFKCKCCCY